MGVIHQFKSREEFDASRQKTIAELRDRQAQAWAELKQEAHQMAIDGGYEGTTIPEVLRGMGLNLEPKQRSEWDQQLDDKEQL